MTDAFYDRLQKYILEIQSDKEYGFDKPLKEFIKSMSLLRPQSYGSRIERRIIRDSYNTQIPASEGRGDMVSGGGKYYEIKVSILTASNDNLNLVQIRLWQEIDYYLCIAYDLRDINDFKSYIFLLTHDEMLDEMDLLKANAAHGTKKANSSNENVEVRYSLKIDPNNEVFQRWRRKYEKPNFFLNNPYVKKSSEKKPKSHKHSMI